MGMRIRTIKPEFWRNRKLASLGREVHDFAARLITASDDEGFIDADPALLAGDLYPFDSDAQFFIKKALPQLERIGFIIIRGGELGVICLPKFRENQRINRPSASRLKSRFEQLIAIAQFNEPSLNTHGAISEPSPTEGEREQGSGTGNREVEGEAQRPPPPPQPIATQPTLVTPPTSPPGAWVGEDFWRWAEHRRQVSGLPPQRPPHSSKLATWWSSALLVEPDATQLQQAFLNFGDDEHWQEAKPPLPFNAFMAQWSDFLPIRRRNAS